MGDEEVGEGQVPAQGIEQIHDLHLGRGVQGADGLVEKDDVRLNRQGPCYAHPLQLASRKLVGVTDGKACRKAHLFEKFRNAPFPVHCLSCRALERAQGFAYDGRDPKAGIGRRRIVLEDYREDMLQKVRVLPCVPCVEVVAQDGYPACLRPQKAGEDAPERALAGARFAYDAKALPFVQGQIYAAQDLLALPAEQSGLVFLSEGDAYVPCLKQNAHAVTSRICSWKFPDFPLALMARKKRSMTALCWPMRWWV